MFFVSLVRPIIKKGFSVFFLPDIPPKKPPLFCARGGVRACMVLTKRDHPHPTSKKPPQEGVFPIWARGGGPPGGAPPCARDHPKGRDRVQRPHIGLWTGRGAAGPPSVPPGGPGSPAGSPGQAARGRGVPVAQAQVPPAKKPRRTQKKRSGGVSGTPPQKRGGPDPPFLDPPKRGSKNGVRKRSRDPIWNTQILDPKKGS